VRRFLDRVIPQECRKSAEEELRASIVVVGSLTLSLFAVFFSWLSYFTFGSPSSALVIGVLACAFISTPFVLRLSRNTYLTGHWITFFFGLTLAGLPLIHGGAGAPSLVGFIVLPLFASQLNGTRAAICWTVIGFTTIVTYLGLALGTNVEISQVLDAHALFVFNQTVLAAVTLLVLLLTLCYEHLRTLMAGEVTAREVELDAILDATSEAIMTFDEDGILESCNKSTRKLFGVRAGVGESFFSIILDESGEPCLDELPSLGQPHEGWIRAGARLAPVEFTLNRYEITGMVRYAMSLRDVSERVMQTAALERAYQDALQASQAKSQFLANMSHELRTPLNAIIGYSELIREEAEEITLEDALPDMDKIESSARHLLTLISEILDLSRIEAGRMDLFVEEFDVAVLVHDVHSTIAPIAKSNANEVILDVDEQLPKLRSDRIKVRQILLNLASNATKFTTSGQVRISANLPAKNAGGGIVLTVSDNGIGIPKEQIAKLFEAFNQGDNSVRRAYGGTGLGLTITRHLVHLLGGRIEVESEVGVGSRFAITLPDMKTRAGEVHDLGG
jgi:signal transduction histidine kinase